MASVLKEPTPSSVQVIQGQSSAAPWCACGPGIEIKVLSVDTERHAVEYLARSQAGNNAGTHRHHCETSVFVLEGSVINHTTGCQFGPGDYCFQPDGDVHEEEAGPDGVTVFASQRGYGDLLVEFFDEEGKVCSEFRVSDMAKMLA